MPHELLVLLPGQPAARRFSATVRVGRADTNALVVDDDVVSAEHCELRATADGWEVVDLGSTNGTFIDGRRITTAPVGPSTSVRLGATGPLLQLTIPALAKKGSTRELRPMAVVDRWFAADAPADMSPHTEMMRAAVHERRAQESSTWMHRIRRYRVALGVLALVAAGAGAVTYVQAQRIEALRQTAAVVFSTMKELELDIRRLEATAGPDAGIREKRARLEKQYDAMVRTLGIYSARTPAEEQLIYRTIHRLGESEANVPRGFVRDVRTYIAGWKAADLEAGFARARAQQLGPLIGPILLKHHLPREFFYLALQESKFDPKAIGPSTPSGVPKGLWQLTPHMGETYGLRLGPLRGERAYDPSDDRHDITRASEAAARYLEDLYTTDAKLSGLLVVASYNMGETRMRRLIRSLPESPSERNLWKLLEHRRKEIPKESYDYMFRVVSAAVIGANPRLFGFDLDPLVSDSAEGVATR